MTQLRKAMLEEFQRRNMSPITTRIYLRCVEEFALISESRPTNSGRNRFVSTRPTCSQIASWAPSLSRSICRFRRRPEPCLRTAVSRHGRCIGERRICCARG